MSKNEEEENDDEITITVSGRHATDEELSGCGPLVKFRKLLLEHDWKIEVGYAKAHHEGKVYKSGEREGEYRESFDYEQLWIDAYKSEFEPRTLHITYAKRGGKWQATIRKRGHLVEKLSDSQFREWVKDGVLTENVSKRNSGVEAGSAGVLATGSTDSQCNSAGDRSGRIKRVPHFE